jgi:hypothetical protein
MTSQVRGKWRFSRGRRQDEEGCGEDGFTKFSLVKDFDEFKPNLDLFRKLRLRGIV